MESMLEHFYVWNLMMIAKECLPKYRMSHLLYTNCILLLVCTTFWTRYNSPPAVYRNILTTGYKKLSLALSYSSLE
jgi:hypothetical protein